MTVSNDRELNHLFRKTIARANARKKHERAAAISAALSAYSGLPLETLRKAIIDAFEGPRRRQRTKSVFLDPLKADEVIGGVLSIVRKSIRDMPSFRDRALSEQSWAVSLARQEAQNVKFSLYQIIEADSEYSWLISELVGLYVPQLATLLDRSARANQSSRKTELIEHLAEMWNEGIKKDNMSYSNVLDNEETWSNEDKKDWTSLVERLPDRSLGAAFLICSIQKALNKAGQIRMAEPASRVGAPQRDYLYDAVVDLRNLWIIHFGEKNKDGRPPYVQFSTFVKAALGPAFAATNHWRGRKEGGQVGFEPAVRAALGYQTYAKRGKK